VEFYRWHDRCSRRLPGWSAGGHVQGHGFRWQEGTATVDVLIEPKEQTTSPVRLEIYPQEMNMGRGERRTFTVTGFDQQGKVVPLSKVVWAAEGGSIDDRGFFQAGQAEGSFEVTARCGDLKEIAKVAVKGVNAHWMGEVPHQRWSQFYNKDLMKHVMSKKLKLKVEIELEDVTAEDVEQMRISLQELGLDDDVQAS
jgi:hypothetical protein